MSHSTSLMHTNTLQCTILILKHCQIDCHSLLVRHMRNKWTALGSLVGSFGWFCVCDCFGSMSSGLMSHSTGLVHTNTHQCEPY